MDPSTARLKPYAAMCVMPSYSKSTPITARTWSAPAQVAVTTIGAEGKEFGLDRGRWFDQGRISRRGFERLEFLAPFGRQTDKLVRSRPCDFFASVCHRLGRCAAVS
jgi:hypothetical protein